jgi:microcystin-dependent protein
MSTPFLGEIRMFGFGFAPNGWQPCNGQTLAISSNAALFSLLGTTYGGNGTSTFQLPNLQSRVAVCQGQGLGLSTYILGEQTGVENVTLLSNQMPSHTHLVNADGNASGKNTPTSNFPGTVSNLGDGVKPYSAASNATMAPNMIAPTGGSLPHPNIQPVLCVNFCIALVGIFPSRG